MRDQLDWADLARREDDRRIVACPRQSVDLPLLLLEPRVGGGLPGADRLVGDLVLVEDHAQPLLADGRDQAPLHRLLAQAGEGPLGVGKTEVPRSTEGEVDERFALLISELRGTPRAPLGPEHRHPVLVEGADHPANVVLAGQGDDRDARWSIPLIAREDDLGALELDGVLAVANDASELLSFLERSVADP